MLVQPSSRLNVLGLQLPDPPGPEGLHLPVHRVGALLYTGGVLPVRGGRVVVRGSVGTDLTLAQGKEAARLCALNILALVEANGGLDRVAQVLQLTGFVRSAPGFSQQVEVLNAASDLLVDVLGERGRHTRIAMVTSDLPMGAAAEISAIVRLN